jgi:CubicO group peptidase (beta-lactamase class C family)
MNLSTLIQHVSERNLQLRRLVIRQHGNIIAEHAFSGELPDQLWSISKTFTSMAIGMAAHEGYFDIHDKLHQYFPAANEADFDQLTIHDLLSMGTGHDRDPLSKASEAKVEPLDLETCFFDEPLIHQPGTHFLYNNAATYLLSKLITKSTGRSLLDFLTPRLFEPLGVHEVTWLADSCGINFGCMGLNMNVHDLSKAGQLMLNKGQWQGSQLVPAEYVLEATQQQISTANFKEPFATADHTSGYGYQIWMNRIPGSYRMDGLYAQYVVMLPEQNAVVTMISNEPEKMTAILELTWQFILNQF